ncbi:Transposase IS4-like domain-containing protein [Xenorhabdus nematophila]
MTMSLLTQSPVKMTVTADTAPERAYLPVPAMLRDQLLLADAGYVDFAYFEQVSLSGGSFIVRGSKSLNPQIVVARNGQGKLLPRLLNKPLKSITRRTNRSEVLALICRRNGYEFRLIRRWFAEEKRFCLWLSNLSVEEFTANDIMDIYRCRWQVELLFKELKSHTNWHGFATRKETLVTGLIWLSLLALLLRRWPEDYSPPFHCSKQPKIRKSGCGPSSKTYSKGRGRKPVFGWKKPKRIYVRTRSKHHKENHVNTRYKTLDACFERLNS